MTSIFLLQSSMIRLSLRSRPEKSRWTTSIKRCITAGTSKNEDLLIQTLLKQSANNTKALSCESTAIVRSAVLKLLARKEYITVTQAIEMVYEIRNETTSGSSTLFRPALHCSDSLHVGMIAYGKLRKPNKSRQLIQRLQKEGMSLTPASNHTSMITPLPSLSPTPITVSFLLQAYCDADRLDLAEELFLQWLLLNHGNDSSDRGGNAAGPSSVSGETTSSTTSKSSFSTTRDASLDAFVEYLMSYRKITTASSPISNHPSTSGSTRVSSLTPSSSAPVSPPVSTVTAGGNDSKGTVDINSDNSSNNSLYPGTIDLSTILGSSSSYDTSHNTHSCYDIPPASWLSLLRLYADRGAWYPCMLITQLALERIRKPEEQELACLTIGEALLQASSPPPSSTTTITSSSSTSSTNKMKSSESPSPSHSPSPSPNPSCHTTAIPSPWPVALVSKCVSLTVRVLGRQGEGYRALRLLALVRERQDLALVPGVADVAHVLRGMSWNEGCYTPTNHNDIADRDNRTIPNTNNNHDINTSTSISSNTDMSSLAHNQRTASSSTSHDDAILVLGGHLDVVLDLIVHQSLQEKQKRESMGSIVGSRYVDMGAARALSSALITSLCRQGLVREAEEAVLTLVSQGAGYDATHPVIIATLLHALTLTRQEGRQTDNGVNGHISVPFSVSSSSLSIGSTPGVTPSPGPSQPNPGPSQPSPGFQSDHMTRANVLFTYLQGLGEHTKDPRNASAKRLLPMCYHHMCDGYRKEGNINRMVAFMNAYQAHTTHQPPQQQPMKSRKQQQQ